ncbi:MAG: sugar phosphate isomerase/epimerase [Cyclobacteriaceae bacterium]|nr:sugar phosphate isomerase/epimerase [Cyclobacteriaceae bacterium]MCX7636711.1 sugar phosphate isomerase/epimerase [Cyclobacteriaceae bacterium]MDW8331504.1 sugar phosphate isomerase/epimerase family protein [Cyclobacteriaceae bacterium]
MKTIKGPGLFLAQFMGDKPPFNTMESICKWAASLGFVGVQIPTVDERCIDLKKVAESKDFADEYKETIRSYGVEITELSTHLQGQLVAVHPAYDILFDSFAPPQYRNNPKARQAWAVDQLKLAAKASRNLGIDVCVTFSGALIWPYVYPWPQRSKGLVDDAFKELAKRWLPILNFFDEQGVDLCYEVHAGEDLHDGITFERFWEATGKHPRVNLLYDPSHFILQQLDYITYIDHYHSFIKMFHVKDAEYHPNGKCGAYGGYLDWSERPGRFRSLGDGQVDFKRIFSKLAYYNYPGWAVLEWECVLKHPEQGAAEGARFIKDHIIRVTDKAFDDFAAAKTDTEINRKIMGL